MLPHLKNTITISYNNNHPLPQELPFITLKGGGIIKDIKITVYTLDECKQLEAEGYKLEAVTYWEGTPETTAFHMIKHTT